MKCQECKHFSVLRIGQRGAVHGSCGGHCSDNYIDTRYGHRKACKHFVPKEDTDSTTMRVFTTWKRLECDSVNGHVIQIIRTKSSFDQTKIDDMEKWCLDNLKDGMLTECKNIVDNVNDI